MGVFGWMRRILGEFGGGLKRRLSEATYEDTPMSILAIGIGFFLKELLYNINHPSRAEWALRILLQLLAAYGALAFERTLRLHLQTRWWVWYNDRRLRAQDKAQDLVQKIKLDGGDPRSPPSFFLPTEKVTDPMGDMDVLIPWWENETRHSNGCNSCGKKSTVVG